MNYEIPNYESSAHDGINWTDLINSNDFEVVRSPDVREKTVSALFICICAIGLVANFALLFALLRGGKSGAVHKVPSTILIINLAIADSLLLSTLPFFVAQRLEGFWRFGTAFCKIENSLKFLNYYASVLFLTAMAGDRYFSIFRSKSYDRARAWTKLAIVSTCIWLLGVLAVIPVALFSKVDQHAHCTIVFPGTETPTESDYLHQPEGTIEPFYETTNSNSFSNFDSESDFQQILLGDILQPVESQKSILGQIKIPVPGDLNHVFDMTIKDEYRCSHPEAPSVVIWVIINFVVGFAIPFVIIFFCYFKILMLKSNVSTSQKHRNSDFDLSSSSPEKNHSSSKKSSSVNIFNRRIKRTLNILFPCLILAFLICWLPYHIWHFAKINGVAVSRDACHWIRDVTFILGFFNSALNPILNSFFIFNFKGQFGKFAIWLKKLTHLTGTNVAPDVRFQNDLEDADKSCGNVTFITNTLQEPNESEKKVANEEHSTIEVE